MRKVSAFFRRGLLAFSGSRQLPSTRAPARPKARPWSVTVPAPRLSPTSSVSSAVSSIINSSPDEVTPDIGWPVLLPGLAF